MRKIPSLEDMIEALGQGLIFYDWKEERNWEKPNPNSKQL